MARPLVTCASPCHVCNMSITRCDKNGTSPCHTPTCGERELNMSRKITITAIVLNMILCLFTASHAAGFEYGDKGQFPGLEQFADEKYIIYSNADTNMVELAVITTDDNDLSIIAEIYGQVIFEKRHEISPEEGREFTEGKYIPLLSRKELFLSSNSYTKIRKWIYEDNKWRALGDPEQNEIICTNYNEIYYSIPVGVVLNNGYLSSLGPKIPVKLELIGGVTSSIKTNITNYGINNALMEVNLDVTVTIKVIIPFISRNVSINTHIPLIIKMLNGKVPEYYLNVYLNTPTM